MPRRTVFWGAIALVVGAASAILIAKPWSAGERSCPRESRTLAPTLAPPATSAATPPAQSLPPPKLALEPTPSTEPGSAVPKLAAAPPPAAPPPAAETPAQSRKLTTADLPKVRRMLERMQRRQAPSEATQAATP